MIQWYDDWQRRYGAAPQIALCERCVDTLDDDRLERSVPPPSHPPTHCTHCGQSEAALGYQVDDLLPLLQRGAYLFYQGHTQRWYVRPPMHRPAEPWYAVPTMTAQMLLQMPHLRRVDLDTPDHEQWYAITPETADDHLTRVLSQHLLLHADDQLLARLLGVSDGD